MTLRRCSIGRPGPFRKWSRVQTGRSREVPHSPTGGSRAPKDLAQAVGWCRKAANNGDTDGQFSLGRAYAYGIGIAKDPVGVPGQQTGPGE